MSIAQFSLVKKVPVTILRHEPGSYVLGNWVEGVETDVVIQANIHPFSDYEVYIMPEADRTKNWLWCFTSSPIRAKREGSNGWGADRVYWNDELYEVMKVQQYQMSVQDHFEARLARIELTPN